MVNCRIANVKFSFNCNSELMNSQLEKYRIDEQGDIVISCEIVEEIRIPTSTVVYHSKYYDIYQENNSYIQVQRSESGIVLGMVVYQENNATIYLQDGAIGRKEYLLTEYAAVYYILREQNAIFIHSSSIKYNELGILFIASSGVGKSTQARLWKEHMGIVQVNDDKNIIIEENGELFIYGNPWSGKSLIDINTKTKLTHLVFVKRSETNYVQKISKKEQFLLLMPHMSNPSFMYNRDKWNKLTDKLMFVNSAIINCNISYEAVDKLNEFLKESK